MWRIRDFLLNFASKFRNLVILLIKKQMNSKVTALAVIFATAWAVLSCTSNDTTTETYKDTAITNMVLGTLKRTVNTKTKANVDTTYTVRFNGALYSMQIDHINRRIFNPDSLPVGTSISRVTASFSTQNGGTVTRTVNGTRVVVAASDSLDYTDGQVFTVISSDQANTVDYDVELRVHKEYADSMTWSLVRENVDVLKNFHNMKAESIGESIFLLGQDDNGKNVVFSEDGGETWQAFPISIFTNDAAIEVYKDTMYLVDHAGENLVMLKLDAEGNIYQGGEVSLPGKIKHFIGACHTEMYAIGEESGKNTIFVSRDGGNNWEADKLDYNDSLPDMDFNTIVYSSKVYSDIERVTIVANHYDNTYPVVWNKIVDPESPQKWMYTSIARETNRYNLPQIPSLTAVAYASGIFVNGQTKRGLFYVSEDCGISWRTNNSMHIPEEATSADVIAITTAEEGRFLFLFTNEGQIWKGRINKTSWEKEK